MDPRKNQPFYYERILHQFYMREYHLAAIVGEKLGGSNIFDSSFLSWVFWMGILTSNLLAGFIATLSAGEREGYIINGGLSGIISTDHAAFRILTPCACCLW